MTEPLTLTVGSVEDYVPTERWVPVNAHDPLPAVGDLVRLSDYSEYGYDATARVAEVVAVNDDQHTLPVRSEIIRYGPKCTVYYTPNRDPNTPGVAGGGYNLHGDWTTARYGIRLENVELQNGC